MADNVTITQGTGVQTSVATADVSGVHYQKVKLVVGTDGSTTVIASDATYGLGVDVKRITGSLPLDTDNPVGDAFGRLRVSDPQALFATAFEYGRRRNIFEYTATAGGTAVHNSTTRCITLSISTGATDAIVMQTKEYMRYQPGKSQLILQTFNLNSQLGVALSRKRVGYFDANNGIFLEQNGVTDVAITLRSSVGGSISDNRITKGNWNIDAFEGAGPSGVTIDFSKSQILVIDLQWLGVGRVRVGFDINGVLYYAHEFLNANNLSTGPYMQTANLPVRWEISATAAGAGTTMDVICCAVQSEGGQELVNAQTFSVNSTTAGITVTSTPRAILSIRPGGTFQGIVNRSSLAVDELQASASSTGSVTLLLSLVYNAVFGGTPTWSTSNTESAAEFSQHGDGSAGAYTGGTVIWQGFISIGASGGGGAPVGRSGLAAVGLGNHWPMTLNAAGVSTSGATLSLVARAVAGTQATIFGLMNYKELR